MKTDLRRSLAVLILAALFLASFDLCAEPLRIVGSPTVNLPVAEAAQILRTERGLEIQISTTGGSMAGLVAVGEGNAEIAMSSRALTAEDRATYPEINFTEIHLGEQVVALGVAKEVWEGGVHALSSAQARAIYESRKRNWREAGGPDQKIGFYNFEEGHGTWELFAQWLYGDARKASSGGFPTIASDAEARNILEFTPGAITQISPLFLDGLRSHALALTQDDGSIVAPSAENVAMKKYPITRPLFLVINDKPTREVKVMTDFMRGARGQELMKKYGFYSADALAAARPKEPSISE